MQLNNILKSVKFSYANFITEESVSLNSSFVIKDIRNSFCGTHTQVVINDFMLTNYCVVLRQQIFALHNLIACISLNASFWNDEWRVLLHVNMDLNVSQILCTACSTNRHKILFSLTSTHSFTRIYLLLHYVHKREYSDPQRKLSTPSKYINTLGRYILSSRRIWNLRSEIF